MPVIFVLIIFMVPLMFPDLTNLLAQFNLSPLENDGSPNLLF